MITDSHTGPAIIRSAESADLPWLQEIEVAAGEQFRRLGMAAVADDEPPTLAELERLRRAGAAWVAAADDGTIVAYLVAEEVDGALHVEQVTVHPDAARRGLGRALIEHAAGHARDRALPALTLTTFRDVAWNAPYYERLGFRVLGDDELSPGLVRIRAAEAALGLDRWPRVCMRREL
ncbi:GNAT family N-acetyltransferase [Microlunatus parietis]|uniref:Ribosomal protein S18 acetylase RimI-like enzyme n=1 Tax=Microlunatus parietis TaxID=682979 RepID=A0A7Y9ICR3_9ACTN|nr:GNAT family N-acetyltransferase [Microlunatus parietis]NYE74213.1 ribosomal protein S18 acetylase RimI-like enzyme [Microlunatus parietis]